MTIEAQLLTRYQVTLSNGRHTWLADEPVSAGGEDTGPSPYDLLLASLAACKAITVQMYAQRKGWPVDGLQLTLSHRKVDAADAPEAGGQTAKVDLIEVALDFGEGLTPEQTARLKEISERCPVHRTLLGEIVIRSTMVEPVAAPE